MKVSRNQSRAEKASRHTNANPKLNLILFAKVINKHLRMSASLNLESSPEISLIRNIRYLDKLTV